MKALQEERMIITRHRKIAEERNIKMISLKEEKLAQQLRELEERRFRKPPELVFLKAHLQAYSRYLGLDPEAVLLEYDIFGSPVEPGDEKRKPPGRYSGPRSGVGYRS